MFKHTIKFFALAFLAGSAHAESVAEDNAMVDDSGAYMDPEVAAAAALPVPAMLISAPIGGDSGVCEERRTVDIPTDIGSTIIASVGTYYWSVDRGDSITKTYHLPEGELYGLKATMCIGRNVLSTGYSVDWAISVNGIDVGTFTTGWGFTGCVDTDVSFPGITDTDFTIKFRVTNEVPSGFGSVMVQHEPSSTMLRFKCKGGAEGDPHFLTWAGRWYDFMGACDMILVQAPHFEEDKALNINIRTKIRRDYSYIERAAVQIGDEVLEVASFGEWFLNGVEGADLTDIAGYEIVHTQPNAMLHIFKIAITETEAITIKAFKDMVAVMVENADTARFHGSHGMMGEFGTGKMYGRDGATIVEEPLALASEWQVRNNEPMLFDSAQGPQYPEPCLIPVATFKSDKRRLGSTLAKTAAAKACAHLSGGEFENCVNDVMATEDTDLAMAF